MKKTGSSQVMDKVIFLVVMLAGMAFLLVDRTPGTDQTVGIAVTIGGLIGLISAHSLQAVFTMLENGFLTQNGIGTQSGQQGSSQKSL